MTPRISKVLSKWNHQPPACTYSSSSAPCSGSKMANPSLPNSSDRSTSSGSESILVPKNLRSVPLQRLCCHPWVEDRPNGPLLMHARTTCQTKLCWRTGTTKSLTVSTLMRPILSGLSLLHRSPCRTCAYRTRSSDITRSLFYSAGSTALNLGGLHSRRKPFLSW